jgi:hypothetical protein
VITMWTTKLATIACFKQYLIKQVYVFVVFEIVIKFSVNFYYAVNFTMFGAAFFHEYFVVMFIDNRGHVPITMVAKTHSVVYKKHRSNYQIPAAACNSRRSGLVL